MKYLSLDLETTGLDEEKSQILEIGAVYVDDKKTDYPIFSALIKRDCYRGEPYALSMHSELFKLSSFYKVTERIPRVSGITGHPYETLVMSESMAMIAFISWFEATHKSTRNCTLAGKNLGMFDAKFLRKVDLFPIKRFHHRVLDPGNLYLLPQDDEIPNTQECCLRAGFMFGSNHQAVEDAEIVAMLIQKKRGIPYGS